MSELRGPAYIFTPPTDGDGSATEPSIRVLNELIRDLQISPKAIRVFLFIVTSYPDEVTRQEIMVALGLRKQDLALAQTELLWQRYMEWSPTDDPYADFPPRKMLVGYPAGEVGGER
jgi:hypothetical protein